MTIHFASIDDRPAFFDSAIHADRIPQNAVEITTARHAELLEAQAEGKEIYADKDGRPRYRQRTVDAVTLRDNLTQQTRNEAARRIRMISPEWRQLNDLRQPSEAGHRRFAAIDAIRDASEQIEAVIAEASAEELSGLVIADRPEWTANKGA